MNVEAQKHAEALIILQLRLLLEQKLTSHWKELASKVG